VTYEETSSPRGVSEDLVILTAFQVQVLVADCRIAPRDGPDSFTPKGEYGNENAGLNNSLVLRACLLNPAV
jgi:hypothetical protein